MIMIAALLMMSAAQQPDLSPATRAVVARRRQLPIADWIAELTVLADGGDPGATELLGELYGNGLPNLPRDPTRACDYFERSAKTRADGAQNLATCYRTGLGRTRDLVRARALYATAQERGWPSAGCALGNMLIRGEGGAADVPRGLALCRQAAEAGDANAQTDYAGYLLLGKVTPRDPVQARKWLFAAAQQRQANAAFLLGQIYWNGDGVAKDGVVAARWLKVAFDNGRADAAMLLGREAVERMAAAQGARQPVDPITLEEARKWFGIAARSDPNPEGRATAAKILTALDQITPAKP